VGPENSYTLRGVKTFRLGFSRNKEAAHVYFSVLVKYRAHGTSRSTVCVLEL